MPVDEAIKHFPTDQASVEFRGLFHLAEGYE